MCIACGKVPIQQLDKDGNHADKETLTFVQVIITTDNKRHILYVTKHFIFYINLTTWFTILLKIYFNLL